MGKFSFGFFGKEERLGKLGEVGGKELGHAEGADAVVAEDLEEVEKTMRSRIPTQIDGFIST